MARFELVADLGEIDPGWSGESPRRAARVVMISDFVLGVLRRFPRELAERVADRAPLSRETLAASLDRKSLSEADAMAELRRVRQIELARIAWRDIAGLADLDTTLAETLAARGWPDRRGRGLRGRSRSRSATRRRATRSGKPLPLLVLAMGKLGGGELNFSSDVDLVFLYPERLRRDRLSPTRRPSPSLLRARRAAADQAARPERPPTASSIASTCACGRSARAGRSS